MLLPHGDACTGVRCVLMETRHSAHAKAIVAALPLHELELYDGILAVRPCLSPAQSQAVQRCASGAAVGRPAQVMELPA